MKIGILTQPLKSNYGGMLQNWALQQVLIKLGHEPVTIDYLPDMPLKKFVLSTMKSIVYLFIPSRRRNFLKRKYRRKPIFRSFMEENIRKTGVCGRYSMSVVRKYGVEALLVGSDQVWRPLYNKNCLYDMFLRFARTFGGKKIAYAASFGVDCWEFSEKQTRVCARLVQGFDAVSVREESGVGLCEKHLGVKASAVLDPTLLVGREEYARLCSAVPVAGEEFLAVYVLDSSGEVEKVIREEAENRGLPVRRFPVGEKAELTMAEWLSIFRDAGFIVTDSFHGTVFSIIFGKPFRCIANKARGGARFDDLLGKYRAGELEEWREKSISFLRENLSGKK